MSKEKVVETNKKYWQRKSKESSVNIKSYISANILTFV